MNSIFCITPYLRNGVLMFDDPKRGIQSEPFVMGADDALKIAAKLSNADPNRFNLFFSASKFPSAGFKARFIRSETHGGDWYEIDLDGNKMDAWLCPVLRVYFPDGPPSKIYFWVKPIMDDGN